MGNTLANLVFEICDNFIFRNLYSPSSRIIKVSLKGTANIFGGDCRKVLGNYWIILKTNAIKIVTKNYGHNSRRVVGKLYRTFPRIIVAIKKDDFRQNQTKIFS